MSANTSEITSYQRFLILQGAIILLIGFVIGFGFLFFLMGEISLWPIPGRIDYQMPGTYDAWRMAHMEAITNGIMLWVIAGLLPALSTLFTKIKWLVVIPTIIAWTIVLASAIDPLFDDARGLMMKEWSNIANTSAFLLFYPGVMLSFVLVIAVIVAIYKKKKEDLSLTG